MSPGACGGVVGPAAEADSLLAGEVRFAHMFPNVRPLRVSNSNCCYSDAEIEAVNATPDSELDWRAFKILFNTAGCTAKYHEQLYFLPLALDYLRHNPYEGAEYISDLVHFLAGESAALERDQLLQPVLQRLRACFSSWTEKFSVVHYDLEACRAKGWVLDHDDIVTNLDVVRELIDYLLTTRTHSVLAESLVLRWLSPDRSATDAAWFLEYARSESKAYEYYAAHPAAYLDMTPSKSNARIYSAITDRAALASALQLVGRTLLRETPSPSYWPDLVRQLKLETT